ncbi:type II toxin-antitoxin system VapC family toxin [soil metagenome]
MVSYLLDTNVISELRKSASRAEPAVHAWAERQATSDLAISVITLMEIEIGVEQMERRDPRQGAVLRNWFEDRLLNAFPGQILPVDLATVREAAAMHVPDPRPERDVLIAATARSRSLTVVTRNIADFKNLDTVLLNPWDV